MNKIKNITEIASRPIPPDIIQQVPQRNGTTLPYLSGTTIMDILNASFGGYWSVTYSDPVNINFGNTTAYHIKATLTVHVIDEETGEKITIVREGYGSAVLKAKGEENVIKTAQTDALKKAAYTFGIAGQLRRKPSEANYHNQLFAESNGTDWNEASYKIYGDEWNILRRINQEYNISLNDMIQIHLVRMTNGKEKALSKNNISSFAEMMDKKFPAKAKAQPQLVKKTA